MEQLAYNELLDRAEKTAKCRFVASARLKARDDASKWTQIVLAVGLLVVPLCQLAGRRLALEDPTIALARIFLAIAILAITLRIQAANFQLRAERHHQCAKLVNGFIGGIENKRDRDIDDDYSDLRAKYDVLLEGFENHEALDYQLMRVANPTSYPDLNWRDWAWAILSYYRSFGLDAGLWLAVAAWTYVALASG